MGRQQSYLEVKCCRLAGGLLVCIITSKGCSVVDCKGPFVGCSCGSRIDLVCLGCSTTVSYIQTEYKLNFEDVSQGCLAMLASLLCSLCYEYEDVLWSILFHRVRLCCACVFSLCCYDNMIECHSLLA